MKKPASQIFLGFDASTQSLTAVLIDHPAGRILSVTRVDYDRDLPSFGTEHGVVRQRDGQVVHAPPLLWAAALDLLLLNMRREGLPLDRVQAVCGAAQQHGTVYLADAADRLLATLDPALPLAHQLQDLFTRATSPVWMDASTDLQCAQIRSALGGAAAAAMITGSNISERFAGPQIRKFYQLEPHAYAATRHIALVSSFMASLLAGRIAPIDLGDGAGTNLMNIHRMAWDARAVEATAPGLRSKLPPLAPPDTLLGSIHPYFATRYGLYPKAQAALWTGDNPASLIGTGLITAAQRAVSLGTSDTCFGPLPTCRTDPAACGHVFGSPAGGTMALQCFRNGSLARDRLRRHFNLDWDGFSKALRSRPPGNGGALMLPWFEPESTPRVLQPGARSQCLPPGDAAANCRALVEGQMLSMRRHCAWMGSSFESLAATGGASRNREILQVMADVFECPVYRAGIPESAALGAALCAAHAWYRAEADPISWDDAVAGFTRQPSGSTIHPRAGTASIYRDMVRRHAAFEEAVLEKLSKEVGTPL